MVYVSWFTTGFGIGLFISLSIFLANRNKHGPGTIIGELLGVVAVFTLISVIGNIQIILFSYGIKIDIFYGIIAGLLTGFGISLVSLISRGAPIIASIVGARGGIGKANVSTRRFVGDLKDVKGKAENVRALVHQMAIELKGIKETSKKEIEKVSEIYNVFREIEAFLDKIKETLRPYFYYKRFAWMNTVYLSFIEKKILVEVIKEKNEAKGLLGSIKRTYESITEGFKKILDEFLNIDRRLAEVSSKAKVAIRDLEDDLREMVGLLDGIRNFENKFIRFDENIIKEFKEMEQEFAKENVDLGSLKSVQEYIENLLKSCENIGERVKEVERVDLGVVDRIKAVEEKITQTINEKEIYSIVSKHFSKLIETGRVGKILDSRIVEIDKIQDPASLLQMFGGGVDEALKILDEEMGQFIRDLQEEEAGINAIFKEIQEEINVANGEISEIHKIGDSLKVILELLEKEDKNIRNIKMLLRKIEAKDVKRLEKELKNVEKAVTVEEQMRFKLLEKRYKALERYFKHLYEVFSNAQKALETLEKDIKRVENLSKKLSDPFRDVEGELGKIRDETEKLLNNLKNSIERYRNALSALRSSILYKIREICITLAGIEKEVREEERRREVARAS